MNWDAEATGFQDPEKGGWEPVGPSGRKTLPGGLSQQSEKFLL